MLRDLFRFALGCFVAEVTGVLHAATSPAPAPLPPEFTALAPESMLPGDLPATMRFRDVAGGTVRSRARWNDVSSGVAVLRVEAAATHPEASVVNVSWRLSAPVKKDDVCLARFHARVVEVRQESGEALFNFQVQPLPGGGERSLILPVGVGPDWALFEIPFRVVTSSPADGTMVQFSFGAFPQTVELAGLELLNFGQRTATHALPLTRFSYAGRAPDATWRRSALDRIEQIRTADLTVRVVDQAGRPVARARVAARLVQPKFLFGSCVDARLIGGETPEANAYREKVLELFDTVTLDNALKWPRWGAGPTQRTEALRAIDWINAHGLRLRGHTLVWPGWKFSPRAIVDHPNRATALPDLINNHIRDVVTATAGRVDAWDVVNEPVHERDYFATMPETQIAAWFKLARACDPRPQLFINEYGMLNSRDSPAMIEKYLALIDRVRASGAPIEGIGVQGHVGRQVRPPADVLADLDQLARAKLPVHITEFDINTPDEQLQADYTRDFLIACYSHPAVTGFIMWGFWQPRHWKPDAALYRADWTAKPNAAVWRELVLETWRTQAAGSTNGSGTFVVRGHLGRYELTVTHDGPPLRRMIELDSSGAAIFVALP
jgi:GH35 family endo-1,4-beta-xylanase